MTSQIIIRQDNELLNPQALTDAARKYVKASKAANTTRSYASDLAHFQTWADARNLADLPAQPETVALYVSSLAEDNYKTSTIARRIVAISKAHQAAHLANPTTDQTVKSVIEGIKRTLGTAKTGKAALRTEHIQKWIIDVLPHSPAWRTLADARDKALILVGYAADLRRSELVALDVDDIEFTTSGAIITIRKSKTDQQGAGRNVAICAGAFDATCPVKALMVWLDLAGIEAGAIFRRIRKGSLTTDRLESKSVALIVKALVKSIGLNPADYGAHSLRAGGITEALSNGASELDTMRQSGHRSREVFSDYYRKASLFINNASSKLGL